MKKEIIAGITTFLTMSYIIVVNPSILSTEGTGLIFSAVLTATVLVSFFSTLLMGAYAKLPFALAPGMGLNAYFAFGRILGMQVSWPIALGMVFWSGVFFFIISLTPLRAQLATSIPHGLRTAMTCGIGLFLIFIGLKNAELVVSHPATLVTLGPLDIKTISVLIGLFLCFFLVKRKSPFAFIAAILFVLITHFLQLIIHYQVHLSVLQILVLTSLNWT